MSADPKETARRHDWERRLLDFVRECDRPFSWGFHDCALFAGGAVKAMTGRDFVGDWRGKYRSAAGSLKMLRRSGYADVSGPFTAALGEPVPVACLWRGDPVQSFDGNIGIIWTRGAVFVGDQGLLALPAAQLVQGWAAGHG